MRHLLRRHPLPMQAHFEFTLVLTFAYAPELLAPLLPPGLRLDTHDGHGFVAVALVRAKHLRPAGVPRFLGRDFFLVGYRIFTRLTLRDGRELRGLRILRSDSDSQVLSYLGNLLTHYNYHPVRVTERRAQDTLELAVASSDGATDLQVVARLASQRLPAGSVFVDERTARTFAGPLPFTFDYEEETHSIVRVEGRRRHWQPRMVDASVGRVAYLAQRFPTAPARLVSSFYIEDIPYRWERGVREPIAP
jgi:hypothetical protein